MVAARNKLDQIAWVWALIFAFAAPELLTFLRALRICLFKREQRPSALEVGLVSVYRKEASFLIFVGEAHASGDSIKNASRAQWSLP